MTPDLGAVSSPPLIGARQHQPVPSREDRAVLRGSLATIRRNAMAGGPHWKQKRLKLQLSRQLQVDSGRTGRRDRLPEASSRAYRTRPAGSPCPEVGIAAAARLIRWWPDRARFGPPAQVGGRDADADRLTSAMAPSAAAITIDDQGSRRT